MKKVNKKLVSLLLALMCLLSCINTGAVFAREGAITDHQAIVLVLDTSSSMEGSPITNLKSAAFEFCKKILDSDQNNQIAIVTFASSQKTYDFSNNLLELSKTISNISASGVTNMANAIKSADTLLQRETLKNGYVKSIVTMADGDPFDDIETVNIATSLFSSYNMYSIGFFEYANESAKNLLKSIQNCGYYEANNVNDLIDEFVKIANDILNPFTITLTHNKETVITDTNPTGNFIFTYKIKAVIKNDNSKQANNVKAHINLDNGMNLYNSQKEINIGTLEANETKELEWTVEIPLPIFSDITTKQYSVTASSDNTVDITSYDKIIIDETASDKNNELDFNKDIWSFENYSVDKIPLTTEDYNALIYGRSNTEKQEIDNLVNSSHGGQCCGMAATTVLSKMNIIDISNLQENANCLYDIPKNERAMSLIGYYYCTQCLDNITNERAEFNEKSIQDKLATIKSLAQNVSKGGTPFILSFSGTTNNEDWGHAVVAYAYEAGNFKKNGKNYSNRIWIYDNNYPPKWYNKWGENSCLYFNENDSSWCIPNYSDATDLTRALSDLKIMNCSDIETNRDSASARLRAKSTTRFLVKSSYKTYNINGIRTTDTIVFCDDGGVNNSSALNIVLPDGEDIYNVSNVNGLDLLDLSMMYDNYYMVATSSKCNSAEFNPNGSVGIKGNKADFKISLTGNEGYTPLQWYTISATGNNTNNPTLIKGENGYILGGDNLSNVTITGRNDEETKELTFTTTQDKVLIGENKNELTVSIDKDNDGTYETVIANSGNKNNEEETAELKNLKTENFKLTPVFASSVRDYTSTVDYSVSKVSLTPTLEKGTTATISVNSSKAISFDKKQTVDLKVGENKIEIVVSGDNLVSSKYTIIVTRSKAKEVKSQNNNSNNNTNNNKTNYTDKSPNTGDYIAKMSLVTAFVIISLGIILFARLHLKTKRKKDL